MKPKHPKTPRQRELCEYIRTYRAATRMSPTFEEIGRHMKISKVTVFEHVANLVKLRVLKIDKHKARSLRLAPGVELEPLACAKCGAVVAI